MSKPIADFFARVVSSPAMLKKFKPGIAPGSRIVPTKTAKNDAAFQFRIDAGETVNNKLNVVLQVNKEATSKALKSWLGRHSSHAKLASGSIKVEGGKIEEEDVEKVLSDLEKEAKENINN